MNKETLIKLRCSAWGITEDEYYCNQCSDFSLEDMARAYRRGKNKGRAELKESVTKLSKDGLDFLHSIKSNRNCIDCESKMSVQLTKAKEIMKIAIEGIKNWGIVAGKERPFEKQAEMSFNLFLDKAEQFIK